MYTQSQLKDIILDQRHLLSLVPEFPISRSKLAEILSFAPASQILITLGVRRSGKSTVMQQIRAQQSEKDFYLNFEDERLTSFSLQDFQTLLDAFIELFDVQKTFYFDEIQNIPGWERFVRRLHDQGNKIYITGSNANLLSRELGTHLTGRYLSFELYPYSFQEYCRAKEHPIKALKYLTTTEKALHNKWLNEYETEGGFPEYLQLLKPDYINMLYESILYRDIITRYKLPNEKPLKELALLLTSHMGKTLTYNNLKKTLGLASGTTVADYCHYLENSYLFFLINRYDVSLKKQMLAPKKAYVIDTTIAKILGFRVSQDKGRFLENIVFLELKRRIKGDIYYHQGKYECDFVLREGGKIFQAIQVTQHLQEKNLAKREQAGLIEAIQDYGLKEGLILTENENRIETVSVDNEIFTITVQPIWEWLLTSS
jgi:predicted AAA+ superfamily ATPase